MAVLLCCVIYAVSCILKVPSKPFMLRVSMLRVIMLNCVMLNCVMLNGIMLNGIMLNGVMLSAICPGTQWSMF